MVMMYIILTSVERVCSDI